MGGLYRSLLFRHHTQAKNDLVCSGLRAEPRLYVVPVVVLGRLGWASLETYNLGKCEETVLA